MKLVSIETKADYLKLLDYLEEKTKYVEVLRLLDDTESHFIIEKYRSRLVTEKKVSHWLDSGGKGTLFKFDFDLKSRRPFFADLRRSEPFFYNRVANFLGESFATTTFGYVNIAFFDLQGKLLFYTITHEGLAWLEEYL